ncbi:ABC transporter permease [Nocardioides szechwanensis]|uniref:Phospholipid/cholesterol/gamma-HCH transport system permease protein n=1 Tax=Nocardioides szechwanensis TaxID=1005944 RepID=A0A1H0G226_9ACTN|nr:ABC transporter permease [Nocardioides szechwanensis]GEP35679.1 ABC transporter permease [Nocardioides szechwanensis]SDO00968.1 phospholipid/cholesterol/gamma-HCH transport system permease protein [Nocardioides szechwanensis]
MSTVVPGRTPGRARAAADRAVVGTGAGIGAQVVLAWRALLGTRIAITHYRGEVGRVLAEVTLGSGIFVVGGGVVGVVLLLSTLTGTEVGLEGYNGLEVIGLAPLTGFISGYANTRELAPIVASLGFAARIGCGFTSRIGAMRINEEIDALEAMAIRPIPYLVSTRLIASWIVILPLYLIGLVGTYLATDVMVTTFYGQSAGTYDHYFQTFVSPVDVLYSGLKVVVLTTVVTVIHCYHGFTASGGPEGVGRATGRAIRSSIIALTVLDILLTLALWGPDQQVQISG